MKKLTKLMALVLSLSLLVALAACGGSKTPSGGGSTGGSAGGSTNASAPSAEKPDDTVYELALTTHNSERNPTVVAMQKRVDDLKEASNGRLNITIYTGGTIASANDTLTVTGDGGADLCWITVSQNASSLPVSAFSTIPLLKYSNTHQSAYMMAEAVKHFPESQEEFAAQNVKLMGVHGSAPAWRSSRICRPERC